MSLCSYSFFCIAIQKSFIPYTRNFTDAYEIKLFIKTSITICFIINHITYERGSLYYHKYINILNFIKKMQLPVFFFCTAVLWNKSNEHVDKHFGIGCRNLLYCNRFSRREFVSLCNVQFSILGCLQIPDISVAFFLFRLSRSLADMACAFSASALNYLLYILYNSRDRLLFTVARNHPEATDNRRVSLRTTRHFVLIRMIRQILADISWTIA